MSHKRMILNVLETRRRERDLLWLLDRDPATLGADQRKIREYVPGS